MDSPLNRAHQQGRKGDSFIRAGKLDEAIFCQNRAAEYLLEAMQDTDNEVVLESLRLQHQHHLNKATRLHMQQMRREQVAVQRSKARTLISKEVQTDPVQLMATRLGKMTLQPSLVNTQEIHETLRETDTLLDFIHRRRYEPQIDLQAESALTAASEYITCSEGVKKPKDDKTVIEELVGINEMLRGHILQLMNEKELLTREKDDLQRQLRGKQTVADETKLLTNSIMDFASVSSHMTQNSFFCDLPPLEMPHIEPPPKLDSDDELGDEV